LSNTVTKSEFLIALPEYYYGDIFACKITFKKSSKCKSTIESLINKKHQAYRKVIPTE